MSYCVYVNKPTNKATIHESSCGCCNEGTGCHGGKRKTKNGEWHKFNTLKEAEKFAEKSGKHVWKCKKKHCLKYFKLNNKNNSVKSVKW